MEETFDWLEKTFGWVPAWAVFAAAVAVFVAVAMAGTAFMFSVGVVALIVHKRGRTHRFVSEPGMMAAQELYVSNSDSDIPVLE